MKTKDLIIGAALGLLLFVATSADAETEGAFFASGSFDYQFQGSDILEPGCTTYPDLTFQSGREFELCTGDNPRGEFKLGYEFAFGNWRDKWYSPVFQFGYRHRSNWFTGAPFGDAGEPELWSDFVYLEFKVGGLR